MGQEIFGNLEKWSEYGVVLVKSWIRMMSQRLLMEAINRENIKNKMMKTPTFQCSLGLAKCLKLNLDPILAAIQ